MTMTQIVKSAKASKAVEHRPVEQIVINRESKKEETMKEEINKEMMQAKHNLTRIFVKKLFSCSTLSEVDHIVADAVKSNESFEDEWGVNPSFELRIRNAELQVRDLISKGFDLKQINPDKKVLILTTKSSAVMADSWGHLADKLLKGFALQLQG